MHQTQLAASRCPASLTENESPTETLDAAALDPGGAVTSLLMTGPGCREGRGGRAINLLDAGSVPHPLPHPLLLRALP